MPLDWQAAAVEDANTEESLRAVDENVETPVSVRWRVVFEVVIVTHDDRCGAGIKQSRCGRADSGSERRRH